MKLLELLYGIDMLRFEGGGDAQITGIAYHSQRVKSGDLFVAVPGHVTDGHLYIKEALSRGAAALVVAEGWDSGDTVPAGVALIRSGDTRLAMALLSDRFWGHPSGRLKLVGVTGTNGKTTTAHLVEAAAARAGMVSGLIGTVVYRVAGQELPVGRTTPESADLQEILATMTGEGCEVASMEVSSHALVLRRVDGCDFEVAVFTNLSQDHLDFHADMEDYFRAKERLFAPRSHGGLEPRAAVVNLDDPHGSRIAAISPGRVLSYGTSPEVDLRGALLEAGLKKSRVEVTYEGRRREGETALTGRFNLYNILASLGACIVLGMDVDSSLQSILSQAGVPGRFQAVEEGQDFAVLVDYAHTPDSLRRVLEAARETTDRRVIAVFGCGGDRDRGKRPLMGEIAVQAADVVFITSDNPRSEDPMAIIAEIEAGARQIAASTTYTVVADRRAAIEAAIVEAAAGDVVVIAGKGHEKGQIFADRVVPFDDVEEARAALKERVGGR
jgi:UDP-N-acetylmuramoyl-L-alanyl-D-glutamate--2,6-diaminopimelate ligase